jgi:hypothetical protein
VERGVIAYQDFGFEIVVFGIGFGSCDAASTPFLICFMNVAYWMSSFEGLLSPGLIIPIILWCSFLTNLIDSAKSLSLETTTAQSYLFSLDADMAVLSACSTGKGRMIEGEGVSSFARAFHHAGARSVVVSLWEVASEPAMEYMKKFYGYLKAGKSKGEALRLAGNEMKAKSPLLVRLHSARRGVVAVIFLS